MKKALSILSVLLLILLPFGCSQLVEDHQCCVKEKADEKKRGEELAEAEKVFGSAKNPVDLSIINFNSRAGNLLGEIGLYITRAFSQTRLNLLMQNIRQYNDAITRLNKDLDFLNSKMRLKWAAREALDAAKVALAACIRANCPPINTCCPSEKKAYEEAVFALQRQKIKIEDINSYLGTVRGIQSKAKANNTAVNALYAKECSLTNKDRCDDAKNRVNFNDFLNQITGRVNQAKQDSTAFKDAVPGLEANVTQTKKDMDTCVAGCPK